MSIQTSLIGHWPFDEIDGPRVHDRSGYGSHGQLLNGERKPGVYGNAVSLPGRDDAHVSIPGTPILREFDREITVSAWVYPTAFPQGFVVVVSRQVGDVLHPDQFYLGFGPKDGEMHYKWHLGTEDNGNFPEGDIYTGTPDANRWVHLAGTYDGEFIRLYLDGVQIGVAPLNGRIRVDDNPITIGGEENGPFPMVVDGEFQGLIDEVRIYNRSLSPEEIEEIFRLET